MTALARCAACGYDGPPAGCTLCKGTSGEAACFAAYCLRCGELLPRRLSWPALLERVLLAVFYLVMIGAIAHLLCGCGPEFRAHAEFSYSGAPGSVASAGRGGESGDESPSSAAGSSPSAGRGGEGGARPSALCTRLGWRVSAFAARADEPASAMLDGDPGTRWASGEPQSPGQWFQLELAEPTTLELLELRSAPGDMPAELELELDGVLVHSTAVTPAPGVVDLVLDKPMRARSARVVLVTPNGANWWSVLELGAVCP